MPGCIVGPVVRLRDCSSIFMRSAAPMWAGGGRLFCVGVIADKAAFSLDAALRGLTRLEKTEGAAGADSDGAGVCVVVVDVDTGLDSERDNFTGPPLLL